MVSVLIWRKEKWRKLYRRTQNFEENLEVAVFEAVGVEHMGGL